uniref:Putative secreted peptide n=1 Tax=Anopheles braziliensis TaxID=58242 RepID=A0A2M3ZUB1_9DIPT
MMVSMFSYFRFCLFVHVVSLICCGGPSKKNTSCAPASVSRRKNSSACCSIIRTRVPQSMLFLSEQNNPNNAIKSITTKGRRDRLAAFRIAGSIQTGKTPFFKCLCIYVCKCRTPILAEYKLVALNYSFLS